MDLSHPTHPSRRRPIWHLVILATTIVLALLASTAGIAEAQRADRANVDQTPARAAEPKPLIEQLRLACAPEAIGDQRGVLCRWSAADNNYVRAYQLYRIVDGSPRQLLTTVTPDGRRGYFDTDVSAPSTLIYGVVARNRSGRVVGIGGPVTIQLGHDIGELRFGCARDFIDDTRGVLCRWSEPNEPNVRGYLVYRSVDQGPRELIASIPVAGRQAHFDSNIVPGAVHLYAVVAVDGNGTVVAQGGPQRVQWPAAG